MDYYKIGKIEAIALIIIVMLNHLILNLPKNIFLHTGNASLLNVIYIIIIMLVFTVIVIKLFKPFKGQDILDISRFLGGKKLEIIISVLYMLFFVSISGILLRNFSEGIKAVYFQQIPIYVLVLLMLIVPTVANHFKSNTVIKYNSIIVFVMMVSLLLVLLSSVGSYVPQKIFPILGNGINETFITGLSNLYAFSGFSFLYFMMPMLKDSNHFKKISIVSIVISSIYLFLGILTLLFSFSSVISIYELSPIYLVLRATEFGRFFQRPDAIFILTWILSMMSYISVIIMFCSVNFRKILRVKDQGVVSYLFAGLIFLVALIPQNLSQIRYFQDTFYRYSVIIMVFILTPIILILANRKYKKQHPKEKEIINDEKNV